VTNAAKSLEEIRSEACNAIIVVFFALAVPAGAASLMRMVEQGWRPVMALHVAVIVLLGILTLRRHHLSFMVRASAITAIPYVLSVGGLVTAGRGTGALMFFVSSCVLAGCFFTRRVALSVVALCVLTLASVYAGYRVGFLEMPFNPARYDLTPLSWFTLGCALFAAGAAPIIGLSALLRSLETERARADAAAKVRSEFLANMSHEVRTPLANIIGMSDALKSTVLDGKQQNMVTSVAFSARNLLTLLNDVLDFAKFETGRIVLEKQTFRISDVIRDVCSAFQARAQGKGLDIKVVLPDKFQDDVVGDALRVGQVVSNLLDNAVKFTSRGVIVVAVAQTTREDGALVLTCSITDTGIGIAPEKIEDIFQPFIQADMSTARVYGGSGLGLAICRNLAVVMGGDISVVSQPGCGSTFTLSIPLERGVAVPAQPSVPLSPLPYIGPVNKGPLRLLMADDDANMRAVADIMLHHRGYLVTIVEDGAAAVEAARANAYDCIIMDMHMPVMTGSDAIGTLRSAEGARGAVPIIALTADVIPAHVEVFLKRGADAFVGKPVEWDVLDAKIKQLTGAGRHAPAPVKSLAS